MTNSILLLAISTLASAATILRGDDLRSALESRSSYALGVNIYGKDRCQGPVVAVRNHDESSCQSASINDSQTLWLSIQDKTDGTDSGKGCMTIYEDAGCSSNAAVYALNGDGSCYTLNYEPKCVIVAQQPDGSCAINAPTCDDGNNMHYT